MFITYRCVLHALLHPVLMCSDLSTWKMLLKTRYDSRLWSLLSFLST